MQILTPSGADSRVQRPADLAAACFAAFGLGVGLMHLLRPDYAPASHMISDYAVGPWGGVMTATFICAGLGCLLFVVALVQSGQKSVTGRIVTSLFAVAGMGLFVTAACPIDLDDAPTTTTGLIHGISFLVNVVSLVLASILLMVLAWRKSRWRPYRWRATLFATLLLLAIVIQFSTLRRGMPYGLANRFFVAVLVAWLVGTALQVREFRG